MTREEALEALAVVLQDLDISHAATVGDDAKRAKILEHRLGHAVVMLKGVLGEDATVDVPWSVEYLRARLAEHPAEGYRTWQEAMAELDRAKAAADLPRVLGMTPSERGSAR